MGAKGFAPACAPSSTTDYLGQCTAGSFHGFHHNFNASLTKRNSLQWAIFFIILSLLIGDAFRICVGLPNVRHDARHRRRRPRLP